MRTIEIKLTGHSGLSTLVDEKDYETLRLGSYKWRPHFGRSTVYARTHNGAKTMFLHRLIMGLTEAPRSVLVDHKDHNGLNNSRTNLRVTDNSNNQRNSRKRLSAKRTSAYKGVSKRSDNKSNPWQARIKLPDKIKHLGYYRTEIEAATAYNKAAISIFGPMAYLNQL